MVVLKKSKKTALKSTKVILKKTITKLTRKKYTRKPKKAVPKIPSITPKEIFLERHVNNPIIKPTENNSWETKATFNPTAIYKNDAVHVIYRAVGSDDVSRLGYARSNDGYNFYNSQKELCYYSKGQDIPNYDLDKIEYSSGGGGMGGCEDPRITEIEDKVYMLYTAFDGWGSIRIAMTYIDLEDFINSSWNWTKPVYISKPGEINKNWVLFPEKINGKYAIIHSISPEIQIEYLDSLDKLDGSYYIDSTPPFGGRKNNWDNKMRGVGPAPIKTESGWLLLYHAMDAKDPNRYKIGAMLLDLKDPQKILHRSVQPVLEPDERYENEGLKKGVIYTCGAVVKDNDLFVYYGGADMVSCVATAKLNVFLKKIITGNKTKLIQRKKKKK